MSTAAGEGLRAVHHTTGEVFEPEYPESTADQVDRAGEAAFTCGSSALAVRAQLLRRIAVGIEKLGALLIDTVAAETALPATRLANERLRTSAQLRLFADRAEANTWIDERIDAPDTTRKPSKSKVRSQPRSIGPVAVFGASNFPLALSVAGGDTAAALAVGCPVIVKAPPAHPGTSTLVGQVIHEAVPETRLPAGVFNGFPTGVEVGTAMVHGGPFPAASDSRFSSVGTRSIQRFVRPSAWQTPL